MRPYLEAKMPVHLLKISTFQGGGEIDNVIIKATMNEILNGESPDIGYLLRLRS